jgi:DNA-binding CsgD family transcriptional regulator/tetratricopeptide (TPR) repeat protein
MARMSAPARQVLEAAALLGARVEVDVLREVSGADAAAIDACLVSGALVSDPPVLRFRHELARLAVEQAVPVHRCTELHRRALAVLTAAGCPDDARLAHHADAAGDGDAVLRFAPRAATRASALAAHREAAAQYERAVRYADVLPAAERAALHDGLATECAMIDRWERSAEARQAALGLWREAGDPLRVGDTLRLLSRTMWRLCRGQESEALADEARQVLEQLPPSIELGWAYGNLAAQHMYSDPGRSIEQARVAAVLAERFGDAGLLSDLLNTEACARLNLGEDALPLLHQALQVALDADREEQAARAYSNLQATLGSAFRFVEAEQVAAAGLAYCDEHDMGTFGNCMRGAHLEIVMRLGRWDEAEAMCAAELEQRHLSPINRMGPLIIRALIQARRGQLEGPSQIEEAMRIAERAGDDATLAINRLATVELAWLAGDLEQARVDTKTALGQMPHQDPWLSGALAVWARRCGLELAEQPPAAPPYALELQGRWREAADAWLELGCPYDAALALLDSGDVEGVREALRRFDELGATAAVAQAQTTMRRLGHTVIPRGRRPATRADRFGLTRREREVLALVCAQLTNADIAGRLFIAEKTVDHHVSSVLAKMGVGSRRAAARMATEAGLVDAAS